MIRDGVQLGFKGRTITPGTVNIVLPPSRYDAILTILGDPDLVTGNIKSGATIFNVPGKASVVDTASATATAATIRNVGGANNTTAFVNGALETGTMPDNGAIVLTPSGTATVPIPLGYGNGAGYVQQVSVPSIKVQNDTTIAGVTGTMPENGSPTLQPGASITPGHYTGGSVAGAISSVQYGTVTIGTSSTSGTAAISSVVTANSIVIPLGPPTSNLNTLECADYPILTLTNSTTVTATRASSYDTSIVVQSFVVINFYSLKTNHTGTITISGTSGTATISSVNTAKAICFYTGLNLNEIVALYGTNAPRLTLTNSTTVTVAINSAPTGTLYVGFVVAEFY